MISPRSFHRIASRTVLFLLPRSPCRFVVLYCYPLDKLFTYSCFDCQRLELNIFNYGSYCRLLFRSYPAVELERYSVKLTSEFVYEILSATIHMKAIAKYVLVTLFIMLYKMFRSFEAMCRILKFVFSN